MALGRVAEFGAVDGAEARNDVDCYWVGAGNCDCVEWDAIDAGIVVRNSAERSLDAFGSDIATSGGCGVGVLRASAEGDFGGSADGVEIGIEIR